MKLNADIIYNELSALYDAEITGPRCSELNLSRPEFYMDSEIDFPANQLLLATVEHLPKRPRIQENSVLVCIGDGFTLNYYKERMCLIIIRSRADFFKVYLSIQRIFDKFDAWEKNILHDLIAGRSIRDIVADSAQIFSGPIYLLDKSFRIIASSVDSDDLNWARTGKGTLNSDAVSKYLSGQDMMLDRKDVIRIDLYDNKVLCMNLFNRSGSYEGCVVIAVKKNDFIDGEDKLVEYLADCLQLAIARNPYIINDTDSSLKAAIENLIEEMPLTHSQRLVLASSNGRTCYRCIFMRYNRHQNRLPLSYICDIFEDAFEESFAFVYDHAVVAFVNTDLLKSSKDADYLPELNRKISASIAKIGLSAGISGEFSDLFNIRLYYLQAQSAIENGQLLAPDESFFNSLGGLPLETYFPAGFRRLLEHDKDSGLSYLETLKVFLEENMSYTSAARRLFVHRSTLIDRISRIERDLGIDLSDPDRRLLLEILLKAIDLEAVIGKQ